MATLSGAETPSARAGPRRARSLAAENPGRTRTTSHSRTAITAIAERLAFLTRLAPTPIRRGADLALKLAADFRHDDYRAPRRRCVDEATAGAGVDRAQRLPCPPGHRRLLHPEDLH